MGLPQKINSYISPSAYLSLERPAQTKNEYFNGEIFAMTGASAKHNLIVSNLIINIGSQLRHTIRTVIYMEVI